MELPGKEIGIYKFLEFDHWIIEAFYGFSLDIIA